MQPSSAGGELAHRAFPATAPLSKSFETIAPRGAVLLKFCKIIAPDGAVPLKSFEGMMASDFAPSKIFKTTASRGAITLQFCKDAAPPAAMTLQNFRKGQQYNRMAKKTGRSEIILTRRKGGAERWLRYGSLG